MKSQEKVRKEKGKPPTIYLKRDSDTGEFCEISKNTLSYRTPLVATSVMFLCAAFDGKYPFWGKFVPKNHNCQFKLKSSIYRN